MQRSNKTHLVGWIGIVCGALLVLGSFTTQAQAVSWEPSADLCSQCGNGNQDWCALDDLQYVIDNAPFPYTIYPSIAAKDAAITEAYATWGGCPLEPWQPDRQRAWVISCLDWQAIKDIWYCDVGHSAYKHCFIRFGKTSCNVMVQAPDPPITTEITDKNQGIPRTCGDSVGE